MARPPKRETYQIGWAIQQEKRGAEYRNVLIAPEGYVLLEFDASGQEFRWMAIQSRDETMLALCAKGEDPHSYMGAAIYHEDYKNLQKLVKAGDKGASHMRKLGKLSNLCMAEGTLILTDRGVCCIEQVKDDDKVWDGEEFVSHAGVVCSGLKDVISYAGLTATPEHRVLVNGKWEPLKSTAHNGWEIEPAMGEGWTRKCRSALRIVGGIVSRSVSEVRCSLRESTLRLWGRARSQPPVLGDRTVHAMQGVRDASASCGSRSIDLRDSSGQAASETSERVVPALHQPEGQVLSQLRGAWDRVSVCLGEGWSGLHQEASSAFNLSSARHRPRGQRWSLRAWKSALGYAQAEPSQPLKAWVYDIVDCGPRHRFCANGKVVHNSLQYRTGAPRLMVKARVEYDLPMELPEAQRLWRTYRKTYPGVPVYWDVAVARVRRKGFAETLGGRRVQVVGDWTGSMAWSMEGTAINYPVQGTGGDQKYLALAVLKPYMVEHGIKFLLDLHDGIFVLCPQHKALKAAVEMNHILDNLPYKKAWGFTPPIPLVWDAKMGPAWGELKEVKE
jgi:hypothetical protein